MCENNTVLSYKWIKTKKLHKCDGCHLIIEAGSDAHHSAYVDSYNEFNSVYYCEVCQMYVEEYYINAGEDCWNLELVSCQDYYEFAHEYRKKQVMATLKEAEDRYINYYIEAKEKDLLIDEDEPQYQNALRLLELRKQKEINNEQNSEV